LLNISGHEIDRILAFVKYVVVRPVSDAAREEVKEKMQKQFDAKMAELEKLYKDELETLEKIEKKGKKMVTAKEVTKIYEDNVEMIEKEFNRLKSIITTLDL